MLCVALQVFEDLDGYEEKIMVKDHLVMCSLGCSKASQSLLSLKMYTHPLAYLIDSGKLYLSQRGELSPR